MFARSLYADLRMGYLNLEDMQTDNFHAGGYLLARPARTVARGECIALTYQDLFALKRLSQASSSIIQERQPWQIRLQIAEWPPCRRTLSRVELGPLLE